MLWSRHCANSNDNASYGRQMKFWLLLLCFATIYLLFRLPWISFDPGIPSIWEYGYNATDEGYYLSGGKEKFVWGHFVDLSRNEAFTYGFSAGTHWLSYFAHCLFGLSTWTWRVPFFVIYFCAWVAMFCHISKKVGPVSAFAFCTSVSLVPMIVAYERTASNDVLIGSLLVLSYVCATGESKVRVVVAGIIASMIVLVKPSVWVLPPIAAAGVVEDRSFRESRISLILFGVVSIVFAFVWKFIVALSLTSDAAQAGVSVWEVVRRTTTHYPLPPLFDFLSHFKGLSCFPRDPSIQLLGVAAPLVFVLPIAMAARNVAERRWNGHLILFMAVPLYMTAVSVMNTIYTHYFLPVLMMLPIIMSVVSQELESAEFEELMHWRRACLYILISIVLCVVGCIWIVASDVSPAIVQRFYSRIYNMPSENVWGLTWPMMLIFASVVTIMFFAIRGMRISKIEMAVWPIVLFVAATVVFAPYPAMKIAFRIKRAESEYFAPMAISLIVSVLILISVSCLRWRPPWRFVMNVSVPVFILLCYVATPNWRSSFCELAAKGTKYHALAAAEIANLVPNDAIVIGERSNQMLMSLPIRTATTFAANSNPIPVIESILKAEPDAKLYALADSQHTYNLQHYRENAGRYRLCPIKVLKMPSFGAGTPSDVYLCRIDVIGRDNTGMR